MNYYNFPIGLTLSRFVGGSVGIGGHRFTIQKICSEKSCQT